jgi:hypothetical protein
VAEIEAEDGNGQFPNDGNDGWRYSDDARANDLWSFSIPRTTSFLRFMSGRALFPAPGSKDRTNRLQIPPGKISIKK